MPSNYIAYYLVLPFFHAFLPFPDAQIVVDRGVARSGGFTLDAARLQGRATYFPLPTTCSEFALFASQVYSDLTYIFLHDPVACRRIMQWRHPSTLAAQFRLHIKHSVFISQFENC